MKIPKRSTIAPAITRVHKLFRLRTVVNDIPKHIKKKRIGATSKEIGQILVNRKLSKTSILETADKLKRAREHASNASFLGLIVPIPRDHQFVYRRSVFGKLLSRYTFDDECPKDLHESAVFTDRLMRLKLTNPYDSRHTYSDFHCRPFLNILTILNHQKLHISQVHYLLSIVEDVSSNPRLMRRILRFFSKYRSYDEKAIPRFMKEVKLTTSNKIREIGRSTRPLLDWAQQVGILKVDRNSWCFITEKGSIAQKFYSSLFPVWYDQLGFDPAYPSSLLLIYHYAYSKGLRINPAKLPAKARKRLKALSSKLGLWNQSFSRLKQPLDFDLNYDVPQEWRESVFSYFENVQESIKKRKIDMNELSLWPIFQIEDKLETTGTETYQRELSRAIGFSVPRRECFQTNLEWQTCIRLRILQLPANPYQGEFEGETDLPMATDNPDVVIKNSIKSLVECKSESEWGKIIRLSKRVGGEIQMYQSYAEDVNANSALFVCEAEGFDKEKFIRSFVGMGSKLNKIVMLTWNFLDRAQRDQKLRSRFISAIRNPESVNPKRRILA